MFNVFSSLAIDFNPFRRDLRRAESEAERAGGQIENAVNSRMSRGFKALGGMFGSIWGGGQKAAASAFGDIERRSSRLGGLFGDLGKRFSGIFTGVAMGAGMAAFNGITGLASKAVSGFSSALFGLNNQSEGAQAKIMAFTKSAEQTAEILAMVRDRAAKTPFAFQEMADAAGSLIPVGRQAGISLEELMKQAEILAASNPMQGLEGASFSLREAMTGDFASIIERFNLSRASINKWKEEGLSNFEIVQRAMAEMGYDSSLVAGMADTMSGRWSTFRDTIDTLLQRFTNPLFNVIKTWLTDVQKLADANTDRLSALADVWGNKLAKGMQLAWDAGRALIHGFSQKDWYMEPTTGLVEVGRRAGEAFDVVKRLVDALRGGETFEDDHPMVRTLSRVRDIAGEVYGGFAQVRDLLREGDFHGGGPFSEDSPFVTGILRARDYVNQLGDGIGRLGEKSGVKLPELPIPGAAAGAGAAGGLMALLPVAGPLSSALMGVAGALGPVGIALGVVAAAAAGLYVAWDKNLFGLRDTTDRAVGSVKEKLDELAIATEPIRSEFMGFWTAELRPALAGVAAAAVGAFDNIRQAITDLANSQGVRTFREGLRELWEAARPILSSLVAAMREDLGPAIIAVVNHGKTFATEFGLTMSAIIRAAEPVFAFVGKGLSLLAGHWREHSAEITAIVRGLWDVVSGIVRVGWELVSGVVVTGLRLLRGDWSGAWDEIKQTAFDIWEGLKQIVSGGWAVLENTFTAGGDAVKGIADRAWTWIRDKIDQLSGEIGGNLDRWSKGLATMLDNAAEGLKNAILAPWERARDSIGGVMGSFRDKLLGPLREARDGMQSFVNGIAGAVSGIAGKLGVEIKIDPPQLPGFAGGYNGPGGHWAWVGEGSDGRAAGSELAYLAPGSRVIPHAASMAMVSAGSIAPPTQRANVPGYAAGFNIPGLNDIMDFFGNAPEKIVQMALDAAGVKAPNLPGALSSVGGKLMGTVTGWMVDKLKGWLSDILPVGGDVLQQAMAAAESALGMEYQWGGDGNPSYDCSGFAKMVATRAGLGAGMPRVVKDIYGWARKGRNPLFTFGFQNPESDDPRVQHMGVGIAMPGGGMRWFEAGGRVRLGNGASGIGETSDYWSHYGYPPAMEGMKPGAATGAGGSAPWNQQAPAHVIKWLLAGLAAGGAPASWLTGADIIAYHESGYDPNAINLKDINAQNGNPSKGLMQVISDHFLPGEDPYNPVHNVAAATRYIKRRYNNDIYSVPGPKSVLAGGPYLPYAAGGVIDEPVVGVGEDSGIQYLIGEAGKEFVIPAAMLPKVIAYFAEAMYQNRFNAAHLIGLPLEMRRMIEAIARARVIEARTRRANQVNGPTVPKGSGVGIGALGPLIAGATAPAGVGIGALGPLIAGGGIPVPAGGGVGIGALGPLIAGGYAPTGYTQPLDFMPGGTRGGYSAAEQALILQFLGDFMGGELNEDDPTLKGAADVFNASGYKKRANPNTSLTAEEQVRIARYSGQFIRGELSEDDPRIVAALKEYRAEAVAGGDAIPRAGEDGPAGKAGEVGVIARGVFEGLQLAESLLRGIFGGRAPGENPSPGSPSAGDPEVIPNKEPIPTMPASPTAAGDGTTTTSIPGAGDGHPLGADKLPPWLQPNAPHPLGADKLPPWLDPAKNPHPLGADKLPPWLQPTAPHPLGADKLPPWLQPKAPHPLGADKLPPWLQPNWPADGARDFARTGAGAGDEGGKIEINLRMIWPDGQEIVNRVTDEPLALEDLMSAGVKVFAQAVRDESR